MLVLNTLERIAIQEGANESHKQTPKRKQATKYKTSQSKQIATLSNPRIRSSLWWGKLAIIKQNPRD